MSPGALLLRADAGALRGTGHIMRGLALAQAWQDAGGEVSLAAAEMLPPLADRLAREEVAVHALSAPSGSPADAAATATLAQVLGAAWVAIDDYGFGVDYERQLKSRLPRLLAIDDEGRAGEHVADLVLDQNLAARPATYRHRPPDTEGLLGPDFALLRRSFRARREDARVFTPHASRVLVTLGGTDPAGATERVLDAFEPVAHEFELVVVVGGGNPRAAALDERLGWWPSVTRLVVDPPDMADLFAWADVAVSAAGTTCWELACLGVPACLLSVVDNQRPNAEALAAQGAALDLGDVAWLDPEALQDALTNLLCEAEQRRAMAERGRALVDGRGAERVLRAMEAVDKLRLRAATAADAERLFAWANDPVTRAMSFQSTPIPWEDHVAWLGRVLAAPDRRLVVAEWRAGGEWQPIGQLRLDADGVFSIGLDPAWRGRGLAAPAIRRLVALGRSEGRKPCFTAYIKADNHASQAAFRQAGFRDAGESWFGEFTCRRWEYDEAPSEATGEGMGSDEDR